jgi:hypothetical protein
LEKDNVKENQIKSEVEETEVQTSNIETTEAENSTKKQEIKEENADIEIQGLKNDMDINENSSKKFILANILDQLLVVAASTVLVLLFDVVLSLFGYMFVKGTGAIVIAGGIIYFILNCIYAPIMEKSKAKNTIAKKILNIN